MQLGAGFKLTDFDDVVGGRSNANTLFLYPSRIGLDTKAFAIDGRKSSVNSPQLIKCNLSFVTAEYACMVTLQLPAPIDGNIAQRNAYLRLSSYITGLTIALGSRTVLSMLNSTECSHRLIQLAELMTCSVASKPALS